MAILSFPVTPINGQQYTSPTGTVYTYDLANTFWKSDTNIIDWTTDQGAVNINPANYVNTTYGPDISMLYLYAAENRGNRLNMVGGIMDPFADTSDIATFSQLTMIANGFGIAPGGMLPQTMTANTVPSPYVATALGGNSTVWRAFDSSSSSFGGATAPPGWIQIDIGRDYTTTAYVIAPGLVSNNYYWKDWTFQGSLNGTTWTTLDTQAGITTGWVEATDRTFTLSAQQNYRFYRWSVTALGANYLQIIAKNLAVVVVAGVYPTTLISNSFTASAVPTTARLGVQATGALTINTDLVGYVSRDGGTTWSTATLVLVDTLADGSAYYEDPAVSLAAQPPGTAMQYKIVTTSANWTSTDGVLLQWS